MSQQPAKCRSEISSKGFTLLEIALAMAILSVVAFYTLDMYQGISSQKRQVDDHSKMEKIATALKAYFGGHEGLPAAETMGGRTDVIPRDSLSLAQNYRFDSHGYPYSYISAGTASGFQVDGRLAAGVIISFGEDQQQNYSVDVSGTHYTTGGDDILVPVEVNTEAVSIALAELEVLGRRVEAYNRSVYAGVDNNAGTDYYGDTVAGAPPILDPDYYDQYYPGVSSSPDHPEVYPYTPYYIANSGNPDFIQPNANWPSIFPAGPPPTFMELVQHEPREWPGITGEYDGDILNDWNEDLTPTSADLWRWPPQGVEPFSPDYEPTDGIRPEPPSYAIVAPVDFFGVYPEPSSRDSYQLKDEGGCVLVAGGAPDDPNCVFVDLDTIPDPIGDILGNYGLGSSFGEDPWGNPYQWGSAQIYTNTDPQYHLFFSVGPDGNAGTNDDVLLF